MQRYKWVYNWGANESGARVIYNHGITFLFKNTDCRWGYNLGACNQGEMGVIIMGIAIIIIIIIIIVVVIITNVTIITIFYYY